LFVHTTNAVTSSAVLLAGLRPLALRVSPLRELTRDRRNMHVKVRSVECEHVGRQLEALHLRARDLGLGGGELVGCDPGSQLMERLAGEGSCRKA
jgi:hypothetical protein